MKIYNKAIFDIESGAELESDSFEYIGDLALCGPAAAILPAMGSAGGIMGTIGTGMSMLGAANDLFGPKGAMVTGDISKGAGAASKLGSGVEGVSDYFSAPKEGLVPTTRTTMGLSPEQTKQIPLEVLQELLRKLAGR